MSDGKGSKSASLKYPSSLDWPIDFRVGDVIVSLKSEKGTNGGDVVALIEDLRVEMETVGECKVVALLRLVGASTDEDVFGLGGSKGSLSTDALAERNMDRGREGLRHALRWGIGGGCLVLWESSTFDVSKKLFFDFGVAGGEGGRSGGNP